MADIIGKSLGRYHILEKLGQGGMATVYKAFDTRLERDVAIKLLRTERLDSHKATKRFEIEAKALAQLNHPNIVQVLDYGEHEGNPYLVMEYVPGGTLKEHLGKPVLWEHAAKILAPIARALAYAHNKNLIHRDVKPSNILVSENGVPKLSDFGIAKILEMEETMDLTGTSVGVGTPWYMSPEQGKGKKIDHRSDMYSLGIVYYELVTGRKPYQADTPMAVIYQHVQESLPRPSKQLSSIPDHVEQFIFKSLAKDPEHRFDDMDKMAEKLEAMSQGAKAKVTSSKRSRILVISILGGIAAVLVGAILIISKGSDWFALGNTNTPASGKPIQTGISEDLLVTKTATDDSSREIISPSATSQNVEDFQLTQTPTASPTPTQISEWAEDDLLYVEDFEEGVAAGFNIVYGNAKVVSDSTNNKVLQIGPSQSSWPVIEFLSDLNDFVIEYRFKQINCNTRCNWNFWYRGEYRGSMSGYEFLIQPQYNSMKLQYCTDSSCGSSLGRQNFEIIADEWHQVRIEAYGGRTIIYLDGIEVITAKTPINNPAKIAFHVEKGAAYQVDDILVWSVISE